MSQGRGPTGPQFHVDHPREHEAVRTTIVGGRPPGSGQSVGDIPRGIEVLIKKAAVDPVFRDLLLARRAEAADGIGLRLEPTEAMMLATVPGGQLESIIAHTSVPQEHRRAFLGQAAAAMLAAVGAIATTTAPAWGGGSFGNQPDRGPPMTGASGGMRMDRPGGKEPKEPLKPPPKRPGNVENRVAAIIAEQFKIDKKAVARRTSLTDDLKAQFADQVKLKKELEREFDIKIAGPAFKKLGSVGQIIDHVENAMKKPSSAPADQHPPVSRGLGPN